MNRNESRRVSELLAELSRIFAGCETPLDSVSRNKKRQRIPVHITDTDVALARAENRRFESQRKRSAGGR